MVLSAIGDRLRLTIGDIHLTNAMQSALEARIERGKWLAAQTEYANALIALSMYIGGAHIDSLADISRETIPVLMPSSVSDLQQWAYYNRSDLKAAQWEKTASEQTVRLVKAQRSPEITLNAGYVHSTKVRNELAPAPKYDGFLVGVAVPLKFSIANKGEKIAAENRLKQSEMNCQAMQQQICAEVEQAYNTCKMAEEMLANYDMDVLDQAQHIRRNRQLAYTQGEVGLLLLLDANRTYCEILSAYYEAVANRFTASAVLQRSIEM